MCGLNNRTSCHGWTGVYSVHIVLALHNKTEENRLGYLSSVLINLEDGRGLTGIRFVGSSTRWRRCSGGQRITNAVNDEVSESIRYRDVSLTSKNKTSARPHVLVRVGLIVCAPCERPYEL